MKYDLKTIRMATIVKRHFEDSCGANREHLDHLESIGLLYQRPADQSEVSDYDCDEGDPIWEWTSEGLALHAALDGDEMPEVTP